MQRPVLYQLVAVVCSVSVFDNGEFFQFRVCRHGNAKLTRELWIERFPNRAIPCARTFTSVVQHLRDYGTFKLQSHDRGHGRILQAEEQILERVEEESDINTRRITAEAGVS